jgi:hypothetical protein
VRKRPLRNVAASVHERLLHRARESGRLFNELLPYFAMERFLYRLSKSPHADKFILKGALMLNVWGAPLPRPTKDIDLLGRTENRVEAIVAIVREVCVQDVEPDGLRFDAASVEGGPILDTAEYEGVGVRFRGNLGRARVFMEIHVGFGDTVYPTARLTEYPTILDFPAPRLRGYTRESTVAEKFQAMVRYGLINSRMKDFFDIWLLCRQFDFDGETLAAAVAKTFARRRTDVLAQPVALTATFGGDRSKAAQWQAFVRSRRLKDAPTDLGEVVEAIAGFLGPVAAALSSSRPFVGRWRAPGPWAD